MEKFHFNLKDYFVHLFTDIFSCCLRKKKKKGFNRKNPVQIFREGKDQVENYFDVVPMIRLFREMQMFISTALT